jgi:lysophospholipase L1-like esterase
MEQLHQAAENRTLPKMKKIFSTALAALTLACLQTLSSMAAHSAADPVPRYENWWQERHKLINQRSSEAGAKAQLIFIGDSITQGWEGEGKETWARYYSARHAVNLGVSGDRTQHVLWRLDNGNIDGIQPKAAVIMIGTNNSNGDDNTPGQIADGVAAIVQKLRTRLPETKVLLLAIFPRSENFTAQRGKILQANQVLQKLADNQSVFFVDFGHRFLNTDGLIPRELMPDYLHLSKRGYELWAESLEKHLSEVLENKRD